jgi:glycosyltransferase involved in cell wall biosynthesis
MAMMYRHGNTALKESKIINWFSPLSPAHTGIAAYTDYVLPELAKNHTVRLWTDQKIYNEKRYEVIPYKGELMYSQWQEMNRADITFFNIGNNHLYHNNILKIARKYSGVVILHDIHLHHLVAGTYLVADKNGVPYLEAMHRYYGNKGYTDAIQFTKTYDKQLEMAELYPLTDMVIEKALGVVVHTKAGEDKVANMPHVNLPLPYEVKKQTANRPTKSPYRIVVFGYLNHCRRLDVIIEALNTLPNYDKFQLEIAGELWDKKYFEGLIANSKVSIKHHGFLDDLDGFLATGNLAINLRKPTMHEASLSQLQIWSHALPSIVTRMGWFAELPEGVAGFIDPDNEVKDLQSHLQAFLDCPEYYNEMGRVGQIYLQKHSPSCYASNLMEFASSLDDRYLELCQKYVKERCEKVLNFN